MAAAIDAMLPLEAGWPERMTKGDWRQGVSIADRRTARRGCDLVSGTKEIMAPLLKRLLVGKPPATAELPRQRLGIPAALAVFSADALSSVAYATEEILLVLIAAGPAAAALSLPVGLAIVILVFIVAASYSQTIHAYPGGGGSYIVSKENLSEATGPVAGAALLIDYVLTVAVSAAAGVAAITSAVPRLHGHELTLALTAVWVIALVNLRGVRESGAIFAVPTYGFIGAIFLLIGMGLVRLLQGDWHPPMHPLAGFGVGGDLGKLVSSVGVPDPPRLLGRLHRHDRYRGDLQLRPGVPPARGRQRRDDHEAGADAPVYHVRRHHPAGVWLRDLAQGRRDGAQPGGP